MEEVGFLGQSPVGQEFEASDEPLILDDEASGDIVEKPWWEAPEEIDGEKPKADSDQDNSAQEPLEDEGYWW